MDRRPRPSRMVLNSSWPPQVECGSWAKKGFSIGAIFRLPPSTKQIERWTWAFCPKSNLCCLNFRGTTAPSLQCHHAEAGRAFVRTILDRSSSPRSRSRRFDGGESETSPHCGPRLTQDPLLLEKILPSRKGVLVFCRTRRRVDFVAKALREAGIACDSIHGDRSQSARRQALSDFTEGHVEVLISTDVAARGLHIERVKTVVHYDIPLEPDGYVHRSGRAGHGGGRGTAVALVMPTERNLWRKLAKACDISEPLEAVEGYEPHVKKPSGTRPPKSRRVRHETVRRKGAFSGFEANCQR